MLHDDLLDPLGNVFTHRFHPRIFLMGLSRATEPSRLRRGGRWRTCAPGGIVRWPPIARLPRPSEVRLPYFANLAKHARPVSATPLKCAAYHSNHRSAKVTIHK